MYCIKCGVELPSGSEKCPLCGLKPYHPEISEKSEAAPYPRYAHTEEKVRPEGGLFILTFLFLIPMVVTLMIDLKENGAVTWSGYALGGLLFLYFTLCLPLWFKKRSPVIFFPVAGAAALCLALYVCLKTGGHWFLPFAFPVGGALILLIEAVIVLTRYTVGQWPHRLLYIWGGASILFGAFFILLEFLLHVTFGFPMTWWSLYPLAALFLLGLMMIIIAICRPLRESLHKKIFI